MNRALPLIAILLFVVPCARAQEARAQEARAQDARAQDATAPAREIFQEAARQFQAQNYALALRGFTQAYEQLREVHYPRAGYTLYNVGRCYEELGRLAEARDWYQRFLDESDENAPNRAEVRDRVRDLQARIEIGGGGSGGSSNLSWLGWATAGLGGAMVVTSLITGGIALDQGGQLAARCPNLTCSASDAGLISSANTLAVTTDVLLFSGLGVAALGVVLAIVLDLPSGAPRASAMCTSDGCAMWVAHAF